MAQLMASVVLPAPPFCVTRVMMRMICPYKVLRLHQLP